MFDEEITNSCKQMLGSVPTTDSMVTIGVYVHIELLVGLYQCFGIFHAVAHVHVIVGHAVHEEQTTI